MKTIVIAAFMLSVGLGIGYALGTAPPDHDLPPDARTGPVDFSDQWQKAFDAGDYEALAGMYESDAWIMSSGRPALKGIDDILAFFKAMNARGGTTNMRVVEEQSSQDGNYSFSVTQYWYEDVGEDGQIIRDSGRSFVIFKRGDDGHWRLWRAMKNRSPDVVFEDQQ